MELNTNNFESNQIEIIEIVRVSNESIQFEWGLVFFFLLYSFNWHSITMRFQLRCRFSFYGLSFPFLSFPETQLWNINTNKWQPFSGKKYLIQKRLNARFGHSLWYTFFFKQFEWWMMCICISLIVNPFLLFFLLHFHSMFHCLIHSSIVRNHVSI